MSRPKKMAMEGIASVLSTQMAEGGELIKLAAELPEHERPAFQEAVWGMIRNIAARGQRLPDNPLPGPATVKEGMDAAKAVIAEKQAKPEPKPDGA